MNLDISRDATPERPVYTKVKCNDEDRGTSFWAIECNEGWRSSIVCTGMYEWTADWLLEQIQGAPYAPRHRTPPDPPVL